MSKTDQNPETGQDLIVPVTGEVLPLDGESNLLADAVLRMKEIENELYRVRKIVNDELAKRLDKENLRTAKLKDFEITVDAPSAVDWDTDGLLGALGTLVKEGVISEAALDRVMPVTRKISQRELKKLIATLDGGDLEMVASCSKPSTRARRVKVTRRSVEG